MLDTKEPHDYGLEAMQERMKARLAKKTESVKEVSKRSIIKDERRRKRIMVIRVLL
jgi:hypothetical protein